MFITNTVLGGAGLSVPSGKNEHLRTAAGYPLTLTKTLARPPESVTVHGNTGGVGDYDSTKQAYKIPILLQGRNLFDKDSVTFTEGYLIDENGDIKRGSGIGYTSIIELPPGDCTMSNILQDVESRNGTLRIHEYDANGIWIKQVVVVSTNQDKAVKTNFTTSTGKIRISIPHKPNKSPSFAMTMLVEGTTEIAYEPYINKTINIYCDSSLPTSILKITVEPKEEKAYRGRSNLSGLQDWDQDWQIPKADELTVTAGTEVKPEIMEIAYWSSERN